MQQANIIIKAPLAYCVQTVNYLCSEILEQTMTHWRNFVSRENVMHLITLRKLVKDSLCIFTKRYD